MSQLYYKGAAIDFVRRTVRQTGEDTESLLLSGLDAKAAQTYQECLPISWIAIDDANSILGAAAPLLFPGKVDNMILLGKSIAQDNLHGIYKILLRLTTIPYVIQKSARMWGTYHKRGKPRIHRVENENRGQFVIEGYPEFPEHLRVSALGFTIRVLELTGAKQIKATEDNSDPNAWTWNFVWD